MDREPPTRTGYMINAIRQFAGMRPKTAPERPDVLGGYRAYQLAETEAGRPVKTQAEWSAAQAGKQ
jgi:hypothetical protein